MRKTFKHGLMVAAAVGAVVLSGGSAAMASAPNVAVADEPTEGSVTLTPGRAGTQALVNVGGGKWSYGSTVTSGYSNYLHNLNCHGSSTVSGGNYVYDHNVTPEAWSFSEVWRDGSASIRSYWTNTGTC